FRKPVHAAGRMTGRCLAKASPDRIDNGFTTRNYRRLIILFRSGVSEPKRLMRPNGISNRRHPMSGIQEKASSAIVAVGDIERARRFYSDMLGLELVQDGMEDVLVYKTGATHLV